MSTANGKIRIYIFLISFISFFSCHRQQQKEDNTVVAETNVFLDAYSVKFSHLHTAYQEAIWRQKIEHADSGSLIQAKNTYYSFLGSKENTEKAVNFLKQRQDLLPVQIKQLNELLAKSVLFREGERKIVEELQSVLDKPVKEVYNFRLGNQYFSTKELDSLFALPANWRVKTYLFDEARKTTKGGTKKLYTVRRARNKLAERAGYGNFYGYAASEYGVSSREVLQQSIEVLRAIRPVMEELHTYVRYELAARYGQEVPKALPPNWLGNLTASDWLTSTGLNTYGRLNDSLLTKSRAWLQKEADLDLWNANISADSYNYKAPFYFFQHTDRDKDLRLNVALRRKTKNYLNLIYLNTQAQYAQSYVNPDVPIILREPANKAMEIGLGKFSQHYALEQLKERFPSTDSATIAQEQLNSLLEEALRVVPSLAYHAGVVNQFEFAIYANLLDSVQFNYKWWELQGKYLGVATPEKISTEYCTPLLEEALISSPFENYHQLYGTLIAYSLAEQLQGKKDLANRLHRMMRYGKLLEWQDLYKENVGNLPRPAILSKRFEPVLAYLKKINEGRKSTLPEWE